MEPALPTSSPRLHEIDLMRFLAALVVMLYHYTYRGYVSGNQNLIGFEGLGHFTRYGYLGVQLFFLISGYVVLLSAQGKTVGQFVVARAARLYPAFWVACTLTFAVVRGWGQAAAAAHPFLQVEALQYVCNLTMLSGFLNTRYVDGVYWTLTIELVFYVLISLLLAYRLLRHLDLFISIWLGYVVLFGLRLAAPNTLLSALFFPDYAPYFAAGMLLYLMQLPQGRTWRRYTLLAAAYLLAVRAAVLQVSDYGPAFQAAISARVVMGIITSFFGAFYLVATRRLVLRRQAGLARLGALTYPLYLLHNSVGFVAFYHLSPSVNKYVLLGGLVALMSGAAYAIHVLIEQPLDKALRTYLTGRLRCLA
jgi:peptidoglycan/LPS O-acetylase OafA/YrhL